MYLVSVHHGKFRARLKGYLSNFYFKGATKLKKKKKKKVTVAILAMERYVQAHTDRHKDELMNLAKKVCQIASHYMLA